MNHQLDYLKPIYNGTVGRALCGATVQLGPCEHRHNGCVHQWKESAVEEFPVDCPICIALAPLNTCKTVR